MRCILQRELTGRYRENRPSYPAIAISDVSHLNNVVMILAMNMSFLAMLSGGPKKAMCYSVYQPLVIQNIF